MAPSFTFEAPSDEEPQLSESKDEDNEEEEEAEDKPSKPKRKSQSPWDFSSYSESVAEEHARRGTTSVDFKISKILQQSSVPAQQEETSDTEPDKQVDYRSEDEDEEKTNAGESKSFFAPAEGASFHANSFMELNLSRPLLRACETLGYIKPTPIQAACIPLALTGRDICGSAVTGSGKTAAYALPTLERLLYRPKRVSAIRVLILTPARELAVQVHSMIEKLAQFTDIRCCLVVGGLSLKAQESALRLMPDIVVATPGRMIDHLRNSMSVDLDDLAVLILDEADRLLELGFSAEIHELVRLCPKRRQTMLFSATMTEEVDELVKLSLTRPLRLSADPSAKRPSTLTEEVVRIRRMREVNQEAVLLSLCSKTFTSKVIIFSGTKLAAHRLKILFQLAGLKGAELHGDLTQVQRLDALERFRKQEVDFLIATDVAARAKRVGSKLRSRIVAEQSIAKWSQKIEEMEDKVAEVIEEERAERALRKAEMEATKAENMIAHKDEIYARPKRTWFMTEKEKKLVANAAKASIENEKGSTNAVISAQQAEDLKIKEKRKREREKNLPRKKRRKLEAAREMLEDQSEINDSEGRGKNKKEKEGISLVDMAYRRAKAVKAVKKALDSGKIVKKSNKKSKHGNQKTQSRTEEMWELFQNDMSESRRKRTSGAGRKKTKSSFKSKSRYKRR
ncbi:DEAD-box ATP-dependent RNA helicase 28 isoform X2 [Durio zibethinus]|uniref:DEAD-box ATP-dependent RNA helicase 28 isoform X2 n=1 Tax=Durio zibethinus TaxID=66656 RepID=A0A6P6AWH9_DURZI|nr:DEAD-box ATP-dependent RNA helicase 28 isoform X2 [Durio zibethinus]